MATTNFKLTDGKECFEIRADSDRGGMGQIMALILHGTATDLDTNERRDLDNAEARSLLGRFMPDWERQLP